MTCDDRREQFLMEAFGALDVQESALLRAHLAQGCTVCAASAAEAQAVATNFAAGLTPETPRPEVLAHLMQRVQLSTQRNGTGKARLPHASSGHARIVRWIPSLGIAAAAAAIAVVVTAGIMWSQMRVGRVLATPDLRYVSLAGSNIQSQARGRIFWDADHGYWHLYVFDLAPPPPGKQYELWFIGNDGRKTGMGVFNVDGKGDANLTAKVPSDVGPLAAAAITDEVAGGVLQPAGTVQLVGKLQ